MPKTITISTHNGSTVDLAHNLREQWRIDQENKSWAEKHHGEVRIFTDRPDGYEVLVNCGSLKEVYQDLFGEAVQEYNDRQRAAGKNDRVIKDYLSEIRKKEKSSKVAKHTVYEMISQVGSVENPVPDEDAERILKEHAAGFEERNPHLHIVAQVLHKDEIGSMHIHTSYIPVATDQKRGMKVQNSLSAALKQQGIKSKKYGDTAQMRWEKQENQELERICREYGYEVEHPMVDLKQEHLSVEDYRNTKRIQERARLDEEIQKRQLELSHMTELPSGMAMVKKARIQQLEEREKQYQEEKQIIEQAKREKEQARERWEAYKKKQEELEERQRQLDEEINAAANKKLQLCRDQSIVFIRQVGLMERFLEWIKEMVEKLSAKQKM